jgi:hypothetical protein
MKLIKSLSSNSSVDAVYKNWRDFEFGISILQRMR